MNRIQVQLLRECVESLSLNSFTEWEKKFVKFLSPQSEDYELSDKQNASLNKLNTKCMSQVRRHQYK